MKLLVILKGTVSLSLGCTREFILQVLKVVLNSGRCCLKTLYPHSIQGLHVGLAFVEQMMLPDGRLDAIGRHGSNPSPHIKDISGLHEFFRIGFDSRFRRFSWPLGRLCVWLSAFRT